VITSQSTWAASSSMGMASVGVMTNSLNLRADLEVPFYSHRPARGSAYKNPSTNSDK